MAHENNLNIVLEAEGDDYDGDSGFGSINGSSTTSLTSTILRHREENGRRYHSYKEETNYILPNDEKEMDRLDLQHHLYLLTLENKLFTCPPTKFHRVLDVGTGTGIWAIDFADEHPEAEVIGIDLSPIQPAFVPPNVKFIIDDIEESWTFSSNFDFIFARTMTGSISDWPKFFRQSFENLNPGGYIELVDMTIHLKADDGTLPSDSAVVKWINLMVEASKKFNRPLDGATSHKTFLQNAGFTEIVETEYKWPMNSWPKDRKFKELGMWALENLCTDLEGFSLVLFTRGLKWSPEELEVLLVDVRKEMKNTRIHAYWPVLIVSAKKPSQVL